MIRFLVIGLLACTTVVAQDVHVEVRLEPPVVPFHVQPTFTVIVEAPAGTENVELPNMVERFGGLSVYGSPEFSKQNLPNDRVRTTEIYVLDPIRVGEYPIAPVEVKWGDGESVTVPAPALRVRALTEEEELAAEIFDDKMASPDVRTETLVSRWELWLAVGMGLALVATLLTYFLIKRPKKIKLAPQKKPWEIAYERLRTLDQRHYPEAGNFVPYYIDLSAIVRYYIEDRFQLRAPELTTPEFLTEMGEAGVLSDEHQKLMAQFLRHCDRVKFARYTPSVSEMEECFTDMLRFVDETIPQQQETVEGAAA